MTKLSKSDIIAQAKLKRANNSLASRKTNYKKNAIKAGITYEAYVHDKLGITLEVFESVEYSLPGRAKSGTAPTKGTPEWALYKRIASRKTYTRQLIQLSCIVDETCDTFETFVDKYTDAKSVDEFFSDAYNAEHKGCYNYGAYKHLDGILD